MNKNEEQKTSVVKLKDSVELTRMVKVKGVLEASCEMPFGAICDFVLEASLGTLLMVQGPIVCRILQITKFLSSEIEGLIGRDIKVEESLYLFPGDGQTAENFNIDYAQVVLDKIFPGIKFVDENSVTYSQPTLPKRYFWIEFMMPINKKGK